MAATDTVGQEVRGIVRELGESLAGSVQGEQGCDTWGLARPPEGWCPVLMAVGAGRWGHVDPRHLGHLILTVTLEGDCVIGIQRQRGEPVPSGEGRWEEFAQRQYDYYAIWGASVAPNEIEHRVQPGRCERLSLTLRFVNSIPLAEPMQANGDRRWRIGDTCKALWQGREWHLGRIDAIAPDRAWADIQFGDGDFEARVPIQRLKPAVVAAANDVEAGRQRRRERNVKRARPSGDVLPRTAGPSMR